MGINNIGDVISIIRKKRHSQELTREEIEFIVEGIARQTIPDYQIAAWAMAIAINGMTPGETADLTMAMAHSGDMLDLSDIPGLKVDKHSTGGVGDKTTLIVVPIVAAAGIPVVKMSGRGLGHTGGTIDKLDSIPGFDTRIASGDVKRQVARCGAVLIAQSGNLVPADKHLYALRDVTATVDSLPLIASSIMSKKIAAGADRILLDVKTGSGAFMKSRDDSLELAEMMIAIGRLTGRQVAAVISNMDYPLGRMIGNSLEVQECIEVLSGGGDPDLRLLCEELAAAMILMGGAEPHLDGARTLAKSLLAGGQAYNRFQSIIDAQKGRIEWDNPPYYGLPRARLQIPVPASQSGCLMGLDALQIGYAACVLGAGRRQITDHIDPAVGIELVNVPGVYINKGDPIAIIHANDHGLASEARLMVEAACRWSAAPVQNLPLIVERLNIAADII